MHGFEYDFDKMTNACGPSSWQKSLVTAMNMPLTEEDRECCNDHDTCYSGYDRGGNSLIQDNKISNEKCEKDFHACMMMDKPQCSGNCTNGYVGAHHYYTLIGMEHWQSCYCMKPETFDASAAEKYCQTYDESPSTCNQFTSMCKHQGNVGNLGTCYTYRYSCSKDVFGKQTIRQDFLTAIEDFFSKVGDVIKIR